MRSIKQYSANTVLYISILYAGYSFSQYSFFTEGYQNLDAPIVIDRYYCYGNETNLADCNAKDYGYNPSCAVGGGVRWEGNGVAQTCECIIKHKTLRMPSILFLKKNLHYNPLSYHSNFIYISDINIGVTKLLRTTEL